MTETPHTCANCKLGEMGAVRCFCLLHYPEIRDYSPHHTCDHWEPLEHAVISTETGRHSESSPRTGKHSTDKKEGLK